MCLLTVVNFEFFNSGAFDFELISFQLANRFNSLNSCFVLVLEDFFYSFSLFEPIFLGQVPMRLIFYIPINAFTFPQPLLMCIYPYGKSFIIFVSIIIYILRMKSHCICG